MKTSFKLLATATALFLTSTGLQAESTYGYSATGATGNTATARVNVTVSVPTLVLLRVGTSGAAAQAANITVAPTPGIPGGVAAGALVGGNSQASGWDGTAPVFGATPSAAINAFAWTNSAGGGSVTGAVTTAFPGPSGLVAANIDVTSTGTLAHPGANTGTFAPTPLTRNTLATATWTYSLSAAGLANAAAGAHSQVVTYTATAL
ncbi:MAG: hypothetical protein DCF26_08970 [Burkholderiales bacterium]|nr:MAG: hypothetical protein DCF26_08970 [Burkholderiales bacterium]